MFIFLFLLCLLPSVANAQSGSVLKATPLTLHALAYPLMDSLKIKGSNVYFSRAFPIAGASQVGVYAKGVGQADSILAYLYWEVSPGDTTFVSVPDAITSLNVSGSGNDTSFVDHSLIAPIYGMYARVRVEGFMAATDSFKCTIIVNRVNMP